MNDNYQQLANQIIVQAADDFRAAYRRIKQSDYDYTAEKKIKEITHFFCSEYFKSLTILNGPALLRKIIADMNEILEREEMERDSDEMEST